MFIAKNNDLIILAKETKSELEKALEFMVFTEIVETKENYVLVDGKYVVENEALILAKEQKQKENTALAKNAVENGYVDFKGAQFETNAQTVGDLTASMLLVQQAGLESYSWLTKDDKVVELTLEDFGTLGGLIAQYKAGIWNGKYLNFKTQIENAETIEEVNNIELNYDIPSENV